MEKESITFEELALLSFLKFDRLDGIDVTILKDMISDKFEVVMNDASDDYFVMCDGTIIIEDTYINKIYKEINREMVEKIRNTSVYKYLYNISVIEFVLKKIKLMGVGRVLKEELPNNFCTLQLNVINRLYRDGFIREYCHKDSIYGDYQAIKLTKRGDLYLYVMNYKLQIENFSNRLKENGYNELLLPSFLITQDLEKEIDEILTIDKFIEFCHEYNIETPGIKRTLSQIKQ